MTTITITFMGDAPEELINSMEKNKSINKKKLFDALPKSWILITEISQDSPLGGYKYIRRDKNGITASKHPNQ